MSFASERSKKSKKSISELNSKNNSRKNSNNNSLIGSEDGKLGSVHKKRFSIGSGNRETKTKGSKTNSVSLVEVSVPSRNAKPVKRSGDKNAKQSKQFSVSNSDT